MKFAFIDEERATWPVGAMCNVLAVSRSGFFSGFVDRANEASTARTTRAIVPT